MPPADDPQTADAKRLTEAIALLLRGDSHRNGQAAPAAFQFDHHALMGTKSYDPKHFLETVGRAVGDGHDSVASNDSTALTNGSRPLLSSRPTRRYSSSISG